MYDPYLDDLGGGEKYMMNAALCLSKRHDVSVFWDHQGDFEQLEKRFSLDFSNISIKKNIFAKHVSLWTRLIQTRNLDALIFLSDGSIPFTFSKKLFIHLQQPIESINFGSWKNKLKLSRVNAVFYNSLFTKSFNEKIIKVKSVVIYPPVDILEKATKKENIILNVGRFRVINVKNEDYKKQQVLVNTFKNMIKRGLKNWKLVIATSIKDQNDTKFKEMIKSAEGLPIEFLINKSNKELWNSYNKAKIYWHASGFGENLEKHPEYAEHFGISTVEAMGVGAVPVVINAGGQKEIIENGKNGFFWDTLDQLQEKTVLLMNDEKLWQEMSSQAKFRAKHFGKDKFCYALEKLLN